MSISDNKLLLAIYLVSPEVENDKISERTKDGMNKAQKEGVWTSRAPFGYDNFRNHEDKATLKPNVDSNLVKQVFRAVAKGVDSVDPVRKDFAKKGLKISKQGFKNMLRSKAYIGKARVYAYLNEEEYWVDGLHEPIVDQQTFQRVQFVIDGKKRMARYPSKTNDEFPLRGYLICMECGEHITGSVSKGNGGQYYYYHCRGCCPTRVRTKSAHKMISEILKNLKVNENVMLLYSKMLKSVLLDEDNIKRKRVNTLTEELSKQKERIQTLTNKWLDGKLSDEAYNQANERYSNLIQDKLEEIRVLKEGKFTKPEVIDGALHFLSRMDKAFKLASFDGKQAIIGSTFPEKLLISKTECRTTSLNKVVELLARTDGRSVSSRNDKALQMQGLSSWAPSPGLEPGTY